VTNKSKDIYTHNAAMLLSKCETFALHVAYAWVAELFSKWEGKVHVKKIRTFNMTSLIFLSAFLGNFIQNLISPQRPLSAQHPIFHIIHQWFSNVFKKISQRSPSNFL